MTCRLSEGRVAGAALECSRHSKVRRTGLQHGSPVPCCVSRSSAGCAGRVECCAMAGGAPHLLRWGGVVPCVRVLAHKCVMHR